MWRSCGCRDKAASRISSPADLLAALLLTPAISGCAHWGAPRPFEWVCSAEERSADTTASSVRWLRPDGTQRGSWDRWSREMRAEAISVSIEQSVPDSRDEQTETILIFITLSQPIRRQAREVDLRVGTAESPTVLLAQRVRGTNHYNFALRMRAIQTQADRGQSLRIVILNRQREILRTVPLDIVAIAPARETMQIAAERSLVMSRDFQNQCRRQVEPLNSPVVL